MSRTVLSQADHFRHNLSYPDTNITWKGQLLGHVYEPCKYDFYFLLLFTYILNTTNLRQKPGLIAALAD